MIFIILLGLSAFALATVAGYFSVLGLAATYSGAYEAVVALGCVIEFGKLMATSFLYRLETFGIRYTSCIVCYDCYSNDYY
jgi:hypothetical protein